MTQMSRNGLRASRDFAFEVTALLAGILLSVQAARAAPVLFTEEIRATTTPGIPEFSPVVGADAVSQYVLYEASGSILLQRFTGSDPFALIARPHSISYPGVLSVGPDVSGGWVVYRAMVSDTGSFGVVYLYDIASGMTFQASEVVAMLGDAGIAGGNIAWTEGPSDSARVVMTNDKAVFSGTGRPRVISGANVPASVLDVGETFVAWEFLNGTDSDIVAYDIANRTIAPVSAASGVDEIDPASFGSYVAWAEQQGTQQRILLLDRLTGDRAVIADNGAWSFNPSIFGDFVSYESNLAGNLDIYLYQISTGLTFQATHSPEDEYGSSLFGDTLAFLRGDNLVGDVFLTRFAVEELPIGAVPAPGTSSLMCLGLAALTLMRRRSLH
jgi:hypothetical protein